MRTIPFREVLHGVAYKLGLDPDQSNFLTNQAIPVGTYIGEWVRRVYDARDWPEWVVTHKFVPVNHIVTWDAMDVETSQTVKIGRVLKVFLVDPVTTDAPVSTEFTLVENGVHVGYDHGFTVWIRYMAEPPKFTAITWSSSTTYQKDDLVYSYRTGEVYRSKTGGNLGHDPADDELTPLQVEQTQAWHGGDPGSPGRVEDWTYDVGFGISPLPGEEGVTGIWRVDAIRSGGTPIPNPPPSGAVFVVQIFDDTHTLLASSSVTANGVMTLFDVWKRTSENFSSSSLPPGYEFSVGGTSFQIEDLSGFTAEGTATLGSTTYILQTVHVQTYVAPSTPAFVDPPTAGSVFLLEVLDENNAVLGDSSVTANGTDSLRTIVLAQQTELLAEPLLAGFTIDVDAFTVPVMEVSHLSVFSLNATWTYLSRTYPLSTDQFAAYIPPRPPVPGIPQKWLLTITQSQLIAGGLYELTFTDRSSTAHTVSYTAIVGDNITGVLEGLISAISAAAAGDTFFAGVSSVLEVTGTSVTFTIDASLGRTSLNATLNPPGSAFWEFIPFPMAIADSVMRGAYADLLKEWGQTDKGIAEEGVVPAEVKTSEDDFNTTPDPALTAQQRALSRYKL